ncbi:hypothetical protein IAQ61_006901 [Plenodomus lingam]|uniref:uncharacterized protein n=1 Tax=Leptosphaeria maculans TaxID=5022 RepID=UPI00331A605A|nr:hypothetical protein IAQ61_006901 [Plenodomus lingam]
MRQFLALAEETAIVHDILTPWDGESMTDSTDSLDTSSRYAFVMATHAPSCRTLCVVHKWTHDNYSRLTVHTNDSDTRSR